MNPVKNKIQNLVRNAGLVALPVVLTGSAFAAGEPLDLTATGTTLAGYIGVAATAALLIMAALLGVRLMVRAFKAIK